MSQSLIWSQYENLAQLKLTQASSFISPTRHHYPTPPNLPTIIGSATLLIIVSSVISPLPTNTCICFVGIEYTNENYIESSTMIGTQSRRAKLYTYSRYRQQAEEN
jgi:hypothetical protein